MLLVDRRAHFLEEVVFCCLLIWLHLLPPLAGVGSPLPLTYTERSKTKREVGSWLL
jgi:hypothetical protein